MHGGSGVGPADAVGAATPKSATTTAAVQRNLFIRDLLETTSGTRLYHRPLGCHQ